MPDTPTPTNTATAVPDTPTPTNTATAVPDTPTPTNTATAVPPSPTPTNTATPVPPSPTPTNIATPVPEQPAVSVGSNLGDSAPLFTLAVAGGTEASLESYRGDKNVVLVFYRAFW